MVYPMVMQLQIFFWWGKGGGGVSSRVGAEYPGRKVWLQTRIKVQILWQLLSQSFVVDMTKLYPLLQSVVGIVNHAALKQTYRIPTLSFSQLVQEFVHFWCKFHT